MRRLQILIDEELDDALERTARDAGTSKAALIRRLVRDSLDPDSSPNDDPLFRLAGTLDFEPADVDEVVYG